MRALIVESGIARGALAACRALSADEWIVGVGSPRRGGLAASSRRADRWHLVPGPDDEKGFVKAINAAVVVGGYEVVFGAGDAETLALSAARRKIRSRVPYPPHEVVLRTLDKLKLTEAARKAGLGVALTVEASSEELRRFDDLVVVKPRLHWVPGKGQTRTRVEAKVARDRGEAARLVAAVEESGGVALLQEVVSGGLLALSVLVDGRGDILAAVEQRADHLWPPASGVSVRAVTVRRDEDLVARVQTLLRTLGWTGLAQLQFIVPADDEPKLIDFNGRFYGSLGLAVAAGTNLPAMWARLATGRPVIGSATARSGVRYQWLEGDLRRARIERRSGLRADVIDCLSQAPRSVHSIWARDDPWPAVRYATRLLVRAAAKLSR